MKKHLIIFIMVISITNSIFSKDLLPQFTYNESKESVFTIPTRNDFYEEFFKNNIPEEYCDAFLYYTKNDPSIRPYFYSIMVHESGNFTSFVNKNKNGSVDYGPSQLNSDNLKNEYFMYLYEPKDKSMINSKYTYYMVITINFYIDLVAKHGKEYALYAYNGGERCVKLIKNNSKETKYTSLLNNVKAYNTNVNKLISKTLKQLDEYADKRELEIQQQLKDLSDIAIKNVSPDSLKKKSSSISMIFNNIHHCRNYICHYFIRRKKYLANLESKELVVNRHPIVNMLEIKFG